MSERNERPDTAPRQAAGTYDVDDLAALLKCSPRHIRRMIDANQIPGIVRFGRLVRAHAPTVDGWLARKAEAAGR